MKGVTIEDRDSTDVLTFDLQDILELVGERARKSRWRMANVEALGGQAADKLHRLCDSGRVVEGDMLMKLAANVSQVIDGRFEAFDGETKSPWLVVCAVDSTAYDVRSEDGSVLEKLRSHFKSVNDLPE